MAKNLIGLAMVAVAIAAVSSPAAGDDGKKTARAITKAGGTSSTDGSDLSKKPPTAQPQVLNRYPGKGRLAIREAAKNNKYLFIFFYAKDDQQTQAMEMVFEAAMKKVSDRADSITIRKTDRLEKDTVDKFDVSRAPMPMVLALAPNGAITGGFPIKFNEAQLLDAFCSPSTEKSLKALQDGKFVFLCVHNSTTKFGTEVMKALQQYQADPLHAKSTEIVTLDPSDQAEASALKRLSVDSRTNQAITLLLAPPGTIAGRIEGPTDQKALVAVVKKAAASCGPGCSPGGCGGKKTKKK